MNLPLLYPLPGISSVRVGLLTTQLIKLISAHAHILDGSFPFRVLASITGEPIERLAPISFVDAHRILFAAWSLTHGADTYIAKAQCGCGGVVLVKHLIDPNRAAVCPHYAEPQTFTAVDPQSLQPRIWTVKLKPLGLDFQSELLKQSVAPDEVRIWDMLIRSNIESVDGRKDWGDLPMSLFNQIRRLLEADTKATKELIEVEAPCSKCGAMVRSDIGATRADFLQGS